MATSEHYPANARYAALMAERYGYRFEDLDDGNGYLFRISDGKNSFLSGAGSICAYPINGATNHGIARDKAHAKRILSDAGLPVVPGKLFFVGERFVKLQPSGQGKADINAYARTVGYPVFCKPNTGSRGDFAQIIASEQALLAYVAEVQAIYDAILVEELVNAPEYRVLLFMGQPIYQVTKTCPHLIGDGYSSVLSLLTDLNQSIEGLGVSAFSLQSLVRYADAPTHIPVSGEAIAIRGRQNTASHGGFEAFTLDPQGSLADVATQATRALGLEVAAVDLFHDPVIGRTQVIEVNSNPSVTALEQAGHLDVILDLWARMATEMLR